MSDCRHTTVPLAANFHLFRACNLRCRFCYATFRDVSGRLSTPEAQRLIDALVAAGTSKLTFVGGEPTLHPDIGRIVRHARLAGLTTCIVTNGARLDRLLDRHAADLDWVGLSVDSGDESTQAALARGTGTHVGQSVRLAARCRALGLRLKLNTVVTRLNWTEDISALVRAVRPERWKVFQVLPVDGQNDGSVEDLLIDGERFGAFVARHQHLGTEGFPPVVEDNEALTGSYVMIDPQGRFFGNSTGSYVYSAPILQVGVVTALAQVGYSAAKFEARGGRYDW